MSAKKESMLARGKKLANSMTNSVRDGKINDALRKQASKVQAEWRKIVTGNEKKRVRDHLQEASQQPKTVKLLDKIAFTMGVLNITTCQYFLLNVPEYFPIWYSVIVPLLMLSRLYHFRSLNWQYFMFDFCYFVLFCTLLNLFLLRTEVFFKICFIFATGALPVAIPIWRNSLIFHDYDKIVSVYVHMLPCLLYYTLRWNTDYNGVQCVTNSCSPLRAVDYLGAVLVYLLWQALYILKTEVWDKDKLDTNPHILTSLRWMAKDTKNPMARSVLRMMRRIGIFRADEDYDSHTMKTKLVFVASQLTITVLSFLPSVAVYQSQSLHLAYIILIFTIAVFNGASFYIEVFSVRYHTYIEQLEQMRGIAKAASSVVNEIHALTKDKESSKNGKASPKRSPSPLPPPTDASPQSSGSGSEEAESLQQISSDMQRTEEEVWYQLQQQTQAFYQVAASPSRACTPKLMEEEEFEGGNALTGEEEWADEHVE